MDKEIIPNKQGIFILIMFIYGSFIMLAADNPSKQDFWIAAIIAFLMSLPMLFIYSKLLCAYPGKDLYDIIKEVFGNVFSKIISLLFIWYTFHLGSLVIRNFSEYISIISLPETPQLVTIFFIGLLSIWVVKAGIEVLGRWSAFIFPITILFFVIVYALSLQHSDFSNLKPIMYDGIKPIISNAFSIFSFPFAELVIFTMVFNTIKDVKKSFRIFFISALICCVIIALLSIRNTAVLGAASSDFYFSSYIAVRTIHIGNIIERFEILVSAQYMLGGFVRISVCILAASKGVAKVFNTGDYRLLVAPIGLLMMSLSSIIYKSAMEMFDWVKVYPYYAIPFQIILPIIILIAGKIKLKLKSAKVNNQ